MKKVDLKARCPNFKSIEFVILQISQIPTSNSFSHESDKVSSSFNQFSILIKVNTVIKN